jgi:ATP-dependent protease ClpP protease subunit
MPTPRENETEDEFVERCIPIVIKEGNAEDGEQAAAICHSMWREDKKEAKEGEKFQCECIECGYEMESAEHCRDIKCPKCDGTMRRKERPGPGEKAKGGLEMKWYEITAKTDISEIWLYDEIGSWGIGAKEFIAELNAIKSPTIDMHINSPGGEVFEGAAIYNAIKRHPANVTTYIDGIAASIASVIALAGDKVIMAENALYMMHNPSGMVIGTASDMRKTADILDKVRETMVGAYVSKSGKLDLDIKDLLEVETWLDADEAKAAGFIDEIGIQMDMAACAKFVPVMAKMGFKHIPKSLSNKETPSKRDAEKALRDVGFSVKVAKTIVAKGLPDDLRDVDDPIDPDPVIEPLRDVEKKKPITNDRTAELIIKADLVSQ